MSRQARMDEERGHRVASSHAVPPAALRPTRAPSCPSAADSLMSCPGL